MEFKFDVSEIFPSSIVEVNPSLIPPGFCGDRRGLSNVVAKVAEVVNAMGDASAAAQGLSNPITTAERLRKADQTVYLLVDREAKGGKGVVTGMLKTGKKSLYVFDRDGQHHHVSPPCVLDFYVHESRQRTGLGKQLFEHMLKKESVQPAKLAIDRPSDKLLSFMNKHYQLQSPMRQMNNYVVFDGFFPKSDGGDGNGVAIENGTKEPANGLQSYTAPLGRYGAPRPPCSMGQIIHNQSSIQSSESGGVSASPQPNTETVQCSAQQSYSDVSCERPQTNAVNNPQVQQNVNSPQVQPHQNQFYQQPNVMYSYPQSNMPQMYNPHSSYSQPQVYNAQQTYSPTNLQPYISPSLPAMYPQLQPQPSTHTPGYTPYSNPQIYQPPVPQVSYSGSGLSTSIQQPQYAPSFNQQVPPVQLPPTPQYSNYQNQLQADPLMYSQPAVQYSANLPQQSQHYMPQVCPSVQPQIQPVVETPQPTPVTSMYLQPHQQPTVTPQPQPPSVVPSQSQQIAQTPRGDQERQPSKRPSSACLLVNGYPSQCPPAPRSNQPPQTPYKYYDSTLQAMQTEYADPKSMVAPAGDAAFALHEQYQQGNLSPPPMQSASPGQSGDYQQTEVQVAPTQDQSGQMLGQNTPLQNQLLGRPQIASQ